MLMDTKWFISTLALLFFSLSAHSINSKENYIACNLIFLDGLYTKDSSLEKYFLIDTNLDHVKEIGSQIEGSGNKSELDNSINNSYIWVDITNTYFGPNKEIHGMKLYSYNLNRETLFLSEHMDNYFQGKKLFSLSSEWKCILSNMEDINSRIREKLNNRKI